MHWGESAKKSQKPLKIKKFPKGPIESMRSPKRTTPVHTPSKTNPVMCTPKYYTYRHAPIPANRHVRPKPNPPPYKYPDRRNRPKKKSRLFAVKNASTGIVQKQDSMFRSDCTFGTGGWRGWWTKTDGGEGTRTPQNNTEMHGEGNLCKPAFVYRSKFVFFFFFSFFLFGQVGVHESLR